MLMPARPVAEELHAGEVVEAVAHAGVDRVAGAGGLDDVAEGGEGLGGQGLGGDGAHGRASEGCGSASDALRCRRAQEEGGVEAVSAYGELTGHLRRIAALEQVAGLLNWDQETQMPPKGAAQRAEQAGAVAAAIHAQASDPRIPEWIAAAGPQDAAGRGRTWPRRRGCTRGR